MSDDIQGQTRTAITLKEMRILRRLARRHGETWWLAEFDSAFPFPRQYMQALRGNPPAVTSYTTFVIATANADGVIHVFPRRLNNSEDER